MSEANKIQPQWLGKSVVAVALGLTLSYGLVALFAWFGPDNLNQPLSGERLLWRTQFNMWIISPLWMLIVTLSYLFKTTKTAALYLASANFVVFATWFLLRGIT